MSIFDAEGKEKILAAQGAQGSMASPWYVQLVIPGGTAADFIGTPGAAVPTDAAFVAGWDGADLRPLSTDVGGVLQVALFAADLAFAGNLPLNATLVGSSEALDQNLVGIAGNPIDTNSGNKSNATLRVVLATDQPNFTAALNVKDTFLADAVATPGAAFSTKVVEVGGYDSATSFATRFLTDSLGRLQVLPAFNGTARSYILTDANGRSYARLTDGTNEPAILNVDPTTQYGLVTRNIPSGTQEVSSLQLPSALAAGDSLKVVLFDTSGSDIPTHASYDGLNPGNPGFNTTASMYAYSGKGMSRIRNLNSKGMTTQQIVAGGDTGTLTVLSTAGAVRGTEILLGGGTPEIGLITDINSATSFNVISLSDGTAVNGTLHDWATWEVFDIDGPQDGLFSPSGVPMAASVVYNTDRRGYSLVSLGRKREEDSLPVVMATGQFDKLIGTLENLNNTVDELKFLVKLALN